MVTVDLIINKDRYWSGSAEKMRKPFDKNKLAVPTNLEKKDVLNIGLQKKGNPNIILRKSPKFNELSSNNVIKQINGTSNSNKVKKSK